MDESEEDELGAEAEGLVRWLIRLVLERGVITWDIGQRHKALRTARGRCYLGLIMIMLQVVAHISYKSYRGVEPFNIDMFQKLWLACGYYITLVGTLVIYLSMLHFTGVVGGPSASDMEWWWWRLDNRSQLLVMVLGPLWCLMLLGQLVVALTYPIAYKTMLYTNFMNNMDEYYTSIPVRKFIDSIQEEHKCCGFHSYQDWIRLRKVRGKGQFPFSCCEYGSYCDHKNIVNYLANYKTWYEPEDYSVLHVKVPFKEKIKSMKEAIYEISEDDELPFRDEGCAEKILNIHPFFWPSIIDMFQVIIIASVMINVRRYCTATSFAAQAVQACPRDFIMYNATHACPRWTFLRPTKVALWRWQRDYLMRMYFYLLYQGKMKPNRYHDAIYPGTPFLVPNFEKSYDMRVRAYKSFLKYEIGKQMPKGRVRRTINPLFR